MNIMIYNPSSPIGGGRSIIEEEYKSRLLSDDGNNYYFVLGYSGLNTNNRCRVLVFEWVKKSWLHRLWFDYFTANKLLKKYNIDRIISYQNMLIPITKIKQTLYLQQSIPFSHLKIALKDDPVIWMYQNIIGIIVKKSTKKADKVIVQTRWMKDACMKQLHIPDDRISIIPPKVDVPVRYHYTSALNDGIVDFFYPASGLYHKNHRVIVAACKVLKERGIEDFNVFFTLKSDSSRCAKQTYRQAQQYELPIKFIGNISRDEVFERLCHSSLIFPSQIETYGLPLMEARKIGSTILASDMNFSHELLEGYAQVRYFNPENSCELADHMQSIIFRARSN